MKKSTLRLTAFLITAAPLSLSAATVYWDSNDVALGAGDPPNGTWGIDPFWSPDPLGAATTAAWTAGDIAVFAAGSDAVNPYFVNVSGVQTVGGIIVEEGAVALSGSAVALGANTIQINNGARLSIPSILNITATAGANLNLNGGTMASSANGVGSSFISANIAINIGALGGTVETGNTGTNSTIYGGTIKGPGNVLTKTGSGEFRYQGTGLPNTTFAKLIVNQGLYRLGFASSIQDERGFGAVPAVFTPDAITLLNGGAIGTSFTAANSVLHVNRGVTLGDGGGVITGSMTIPGAITGIGSLSHLNTGTLVLTGNNTYTGTTFATLGIINAANANALGTTAGDTQIGAGGEVRYDGATINFTVNEPFQIAGGGGGGGGALTIQNAATPNFSGPVTLTADATVTVSGTSAATFTNANAFTSTADQNLTLQGGSGAGNGGTITGVIALGAGGLTKLQGGRWTLTAANTYSGPTTIGAGTLQLGNGLAGSDGTIASSLIANNGTLTFNRFGNDSYGGIISGSGAVTKLGAGTQALTGANIYTGTTTVSGGMLKLGNSAALGFGGVQTTSTGTTVVGSGATLDLNGAGTINEPIVLNGSGLGAGGALINSSGTTSTLRSGIAGGRVGAITGTGSGYRTAPTVTITGTGTGATATASLGVTAASFTLDPGDRNYSVAPTVTISGGSGSGATATAILTAGVVTGITITNAGTGFTTAPTITFSGGTSTGSITPTGIGNDTEFNVSGIAITAAGSGYTGTPTYTFGSGNATPGTLTLSSVSLASDSSIGGTGNTTIDSVVFESGGARVLTKVGTGTLQLNGVQNYSTLNTQGGRTDLNNTLGTGTSIINADAQTNITVSETLGALNIGAGAVVTLGNPPPPAPALAGDFLADGLPEAGDALTITQVQGVPEPGSATLLLAGALGLLSRRRTRVVQ